MYRKNLNVSGLFAIIVSLIGLLGIIGHGFDIYIFKAFVSQSGKEIALFTSIALFFLGGVLFYFFRFPSVVQKAPRSKIMTGLLLISLGIAVFNIFEYLALAKYDLTLPLIQDYPSVAMAYLTAVQLTLISTGLILFNRDSKGLWSTNLLALIGFFLLETCLFAIVGYVAQVPVLFNFVQAIPTIISFILISFIFLQQALRSQALLSPLLSPIPKVRVLSILSIVAAASILLAGIAIIQLFHYLLGQSVFILDAERLIVTFEILTVLMSTLTLSLSLRVLFYFEASLNSEAEAKSSEERFRLLVSAVQDYAIYMLDPLGQVTSWNEGAERIQGYSQSEILGKHFSIFYTKDEQAQGVPEHCLDLAQANDRFETEGWLVRKDGTTLWARCTLTATRNNQNQLIGYSKVIRDLSVQRAMENSLHQTIFELTNMRRAIDAASIVAITNSQGVLTDVNQAFCAISKYNKEELVGQTYQLVNSKYHQPAFFRGLWQTIEAGKIWKGEIRNRAKDGQIYWVDTTICPFVNGQPTPVQYISIHHDITPLKIAQESLKASVYKQKILTSLSQQALSGMEIDKLLQQACVLVARTLKVPLAKVLCLEPSGDSFLLRAGFGWHEGLVGHFTIPAGPESQSGYTLLVEEPVVVEDFHTEERFSQPALLKDHHVVSGMSVIIHGEKPEKPFGVLGVYSTVPRHFESEEVMFMQALANVIGITVERKHADSLLRELNLDLERRVTERTHQLEVAYRDAEEANRLKTKVLAFVSHDFKNPLAAMGRFIQILSEHEDNLSPHQQEIISYIADGIAQLQSMVSDILDKARMEEGQLTLSLEWINLQALLKELVPMVESLAIDKQIKINYEIQPGLSEIEADPRFLRQIIVNLMSNAIKYNRKGGSVTLTIQESDNHQYVSIAVQDTGLGIPAEKIPLLFQEYFRGGAATYETVAGTGLGLAFIKKLIAMHGGHITVTSQVGQGSTFTVLLPRRMTIAELPSGKFPSQENIAQGSFITE